jgi:hypothetical protein
MRQLLIGFVAYKYTVALRLYPRKGTKRHLGISNDGMVVPRFAPWVDQCVLPLPEYVFHISIQFPSYILLSTNFLGN